MCKLEQQFTGFHGVKTTSLRSSTNSEAALALGILIIQSTITEATIIFEPQGGLEATYAVVLGSLEAHWKVDFLMIIELFARCFHFVTIHAFDGRTDKVMDGQTALRSTTPRLHRMQRGKNYSTRLPSKFLI